MHGLARNSATSVIPAIKMNFIIPIHRSLGSPFRLAPLLQRLPRAVSTKAKTFGELDLSSEVLGAVDSLGFEEATDIQSMVIPTLLHDRRSDFAVASHTGSGKTLAYMLPLLHSLKEAEAVKGMPVKAKRPRALVLGPTRELVEQIYSVTKQLTRVAKCRSVLLTGSGEMAAQKAALSRGVDVLIGTPGKIVQHAEKGNLYYGDVELVVLDEADTMMDRGFGIEVEAILKAVQNKENRARCVLVSATMTKQVKKLVHDTFPKIRMIETSTLHKGVSGSRHTFLPAQTDKLDVAMQLLDSDYSKGQRTIVFCNTLDSCRAIEHYLSERGIPTVCYHGDVPVADRKVAISLFSQVHGGDDESPPILVATDLAARGLDIPGRVDHVINFDFPLNPVDYLHRSGRTGRAGAKGKITSLVGKADRTLATRIEESLAKGLPLDSLSADRSILPMHMRPKRNDGNDKRGNGRGNNRGGRRGGGRTGSRAAGDKPQQHYAGKRGAGTRGRSDGSSGGRRGQSTTRGRNSRRTSR
jgi:superfamily II DNA/RNA helicase